VSSHPDPLHLIEAKFLAPPVIELRRAGAGVVRHLRRLLQRPAIFQVRRDAGRAETVVAEFGGNAGRRRAPADHRVGIRLGQGCARQQCGAAADGAEQRPLGIFGQARTLDVGEEVGFKIVVARHGVRLTAICEAAGRPGMHFVPVKSLTQQAHGMVLKVRETLVGQRTLMVNTLRGHAAEFGVIAARGLRQVDPLMIAIEEDTAIPPEAKDMAALLGRQIEELDTRIKEIDVKLNAAHKANEISQRLATIPGVGPVTALTLAIEIDPVAFESGRHLAAWAGLTPKEHSTGGKQRMGGISRAGNERLRVLLVAGATSVINAAMRPGSKQMTDWLRDLLARKPRKVVAVALANKMARVAWALMTRGEVYRRPVAATVVVAA
jgi:transposase